MSDSKTTPTDSTREIEPVDAGRRGAVTYLALGVALVAGGGLLAPRAAQAYGGRCYKCNCCLYEGSQNTCTNCGHSYENHSGQTCEKPR